MKSAAVIAPNLGLYLDRPPVAMKPGMLQDGLNFRVKEGRLNNLNIGWSAFESTITLNGPVMLVYDFVLRSGSDFLLFASLTDVYKYAPNPGGAGSVSYLTPVYVTGTAAASGTAVTGTGTSWNTTTPRKPKAGDEISFGSNNVTSTTATWFTIQSVTDDTHLVLTASAGTVAGGNYTIRLKFQGNATNLWFADTFLNASPENTDQVFLTNGIDLPMWWDGVASHLSILGNNFTCKALRVYSGQMIYLNVTQGGVALPTSIITSDANQPKVTNGTGISGQYIVHADPGEIYNAEKLGNTLAIYSRNVVTLAQFVGDPLEYTFRQISFDRGMLSPRAFTKFPAYHEYLGHDTMYKFDGATITPINSHVFRAVLSQVDPVRQKLGYTHRDEQQGEIFWVVPSTVDPNSGVSTSPPSQAYVEHYLEEVGQNHTPFSKRTHAFTATGFYSRQNSITWDQLTNAWNQYNFRWNDQFFSAAFPLNIAGDTNGKLWNFNAAQDANGAALASYIRFGRRALADGKMRGLVSRVYPFGEFFSTPLLVTTNLSDFATGPATIVDQKTWQQNQPEGLFFVSVFRRGRYFDVQFGSAGPSQPWTVDGYDADVRPGGNR